MAVARSVLVLFLALAGAVATGCGPRIAPDVAVQLAQPSPVGDQALGAGDVFEVRVFNEADLSGTYRVGSDGTIDFPLIGQLQVEGLEAHALSSMIAQKLAQKYLRSPQVSILIKEQSSKQIVVFGQVNKPGNYPYRSNMNIMEAISVAGGFTPMASMNRTTLTRIETGQKKSQEVPVDDMAKGKVPYLILRPGDVVNVPERIF